MTSSIIAPVHLINAHSTDWKFSGIYKITNMVNDKCYIGQAINIRERLMEHINKHKKVHNNIYRAITKYGIDCFTCEIVVIINIYGKSSNQIKQELNCQEIFYINLYESYNNGYNQTPGGDSGRLGFKHSPETILKLKESHKGYTPQAAVNKMKQTFVYDCENKTISNYKSISEAAQLTGADERSVAQIRANKEFKVGGRCISKRRFLFAETIDELHERITYNSIKYYDRFHKED